MSEIRAANSVDDTFLSEEGKGTSRCRGARHLTEGLRLAAAPTFAVMALLASLPGNSAAAGVLCLIADHASLFSGMVPMYLLMTAFHLPPWLNLFFDIFPTKGACASSRAPAVRRSGPARPR